jgi:hypothetical protein
MYGKTQLSGQEYADAAVNQSVCLHFRMEHAGKILIDFDEKHYRY